MLIWITHNVNNVELVASITIRYPIFYSPTKLQNNQALIKLLWQKGNFGFTYSYLSCVNEHLITVEISNFVILRNEHWKYGAFCSIAQKRVMFFMYNFTAQMAWLILYLEMCVRFILIPK